MQTQCPHCDTTFRVTETQLQAADGFVRCGICNEVFNTTEAAAEITPHSSSLVQQGGDDSPPTDISDANHFNAPSANDEPDKDTFDFFNEENNKSLPHVVPDQFRDAYSPAMSALSSFSLWSIAIVLLSATLILQYAWFNQDQLHKTPQLQLAFDKFCQLVKCETISIRDPENIELITRNVLSHPTEKDALLINVTLKNNAAFTQPFPVMQIDFSDIRGNTVVARRFWPNEYLSNEQPGLLPAKTEASISLEIQDPGEQAMTYEFNFL